MAYNTIDDIIKIVNEYGEKVGRQLQGEEIAKMKFSLPERKTIIAF